MLNQRNYICLGAKDFEIYGFVIIYNLQLKSSTPSASQPPLKRGINKISELRYVGLEDFRITFDYVLILSSLNLRNLNSDKSHPPCLLRSHPSRGE